LLLLTNSRSVSSPGKFLYKQKHDLHTASFPSYCVLGTAALSHKKPASAGTSHVFDRV